MCIQRMNVAHFNASMRPASVWCAPTNFPQSNSASQAEDVSTVTYRWLQAQEAEVKHLSAHQAAPTYEHLPDWSHGKSWSSAYQAVVLCDGHPATAPRSDETFTLRDTILAFPVLKVMAVSQRDINPDEFPPAGDDAMEKGVHKIITKRLPPVQLKRAIEKIVQDVFVRCQLHS
jgi:hypothetical protein